MAELRRQASGHGELVEGILNELRQQVPAVISIAEVAALQQSQREANEIYEALISRLPNRLLEQQITLEDLAEVPGAKRPWRDPRRWVAALMKPILYRQVQFNREVCRRLRATSDERAPLVALCARLVGTTNILAARLGEVDRANAQWTVQLLNRVQDLLSSSSSTHDRPSGHGSNENGASARLDELSHNVAAELAAIEADVTRTTDTLRQQVNLLQVHLRQLEEELRGRNTQPVAEVVVPAPAKQLPPERQQPAVPLPANPPAAPEFDFLVFEALTRGSEEQISSEQEKYLPFFSGKSNVLDGGCGRGEFLEILKRGGVEAYGIDADRQMVEHCKAKGLRVEIASLFEHLELLPDATLGGLFLGQVVEHLPLPVLSALPALAYRKLQPGAWFLAETINPTCLTTFSGAFYADPTHYKPVHPKALEYFYTAAGFTELQTVFSAPVPADAKLKPVRETAPIDPTTKDLVSQINANLDRLNSVLYNFGNFAMAGRKPESAA